MELLAGQLSDPGPISDFLQMDHSKLEDHTVSLRSLQTELETDQSSLVTAWGEEWYELVVEMVNLELTSVPICAIRESNYDESVRLREAAISSLADRRIADQLGGTIINFGGTHAQKQGLWGTENVEWLGDYLAHGSPVVEGSVKTIWVPAASILAVPGSGTQDFDLSASPPNELLRVINETWPDHSVYLPLDDPLFQNGKIPLNVSGEIFVSAQKNHYDAIVLLQIAQRDFVGD